MLPHPNLISGFRTVLVIVSLVLMASTARAADSDGYVRFCSDAQSITEAHVQALIDAQRKHFPLQESDVDIVEAATDAIHAASLGLTTIKSASVSIAVREYGTVTGHGPFSPEEILFRVDGDKGVVHVLATFEKNDQVRTVRLATSEEIDLALDFGRAMATYMLFNDLTAADAEIPRSGCERAFREQFYSIPEILPEISAAIRSQPSQDQGLVDRVHDAYARFVETTKASNGDDAVIARRTLDSIGPSPTITVIYRDQYQVRDMHAEFDVVRLDGTKHAYAMFEIDDTGKTNLGPMPICVVGDASCAAYFSWP